MTDETRSVLRKWLWADYLVYDHFKNKLEELVFSIQPQKDFQNRLSAFRATNNELNPESYGLLPSDFPKNFSARTVDGQNFRSLEEILDLMRQTYCRSIGVQFMHIDDHDVRNWLQTRMEGSRNRMQLLSGFYGRV